MNTIVVLTWRRPELLVLSLESLRRCRRIEAYQLYFPLNKDCHPETQRVIHSLCRGLKYEIAWRPPGWYIDHANGEALKDAADRSTLYFMFVAEDEEVSADYLEMMEYCVNNFDFDDGKLLGVPAGYVVRPPASDDMRRLVQSSAFPTVAPMLMVDAFNRWVRPHLCTEYYRDEVEGDWTNVLGGHHHGYIHRPDYFKTYFREYEMQVFGIDGLLHRIARRHGLHSLIPLVPRAHEIGFFGTHYPQHKFAWDRLKATDQRSVDSQAAVLRQLIDTGEVTGLFGRNSRYQSLLATHSWTDLYVGTEPHAKFICWNHDERRCYCGQNFPIPMSELQLCSDGGLMHLTCGGYLGKPRRDAIMRWEV